MGRPGSRPATRGPGRRKRGLNENYAREIMELHTLGVDGGYTQKDVTEVARALTGWSIAGVRHGEPRFTFNARVHDRGDKVILGRKIGGGGQEEGEQVIHLLLGEVLRAHLGAPDLGRVFPGHAASPARFPGVMLA